MDIPAAYEGEVVDRAWGMELSDFDGQEEQGVHEQGGQVRAALVLEVLRVPAR